MRTVLDVENTTAKREGKVLLDPFEPGLTLTQLVVVVVRSPKGLCVQQ